MKNSFSLKTRKNKEYIYISIKILILIFKIKNILKKSTEISLHVTLNSTVNARTYITHHDHQKDQRESS